MDYDYGTTREKGKERIIITGRYPQYIVCEDENQNFHMNNYREPPELTTSQIENQRKNEQEYNAFKEQYPDEHMVMKQRSSLVRKYREIKSVDYENIEYVETAPPLFDKEAAITGLTIEGDDIGIIEEYTLGVEMAKFLNFDIDAFIEGELEFEFPVLNDEMDDDDSEDNHEVIKEKYKQKIWLCRTHDISRLENRNNIYTYIFDGKSSKNDFLNYPMPVFLRMFPEYIIDFSEWKYYEEGIEYIKQLQKKYKNLCNTFFIESRDKLPIEVYCEKTDKKITSSVEMKRMKRELRGYVQDAQNVINDYLATRKVSTDPLEQAILAELYAMLSKDNVYFRKCKKCNRYYVGNKGRVFCSASSFEPIKVLQAEILMRKKDKCISYEEAIEQYLKGKGKDQQKDYDLSFIELNVGKPEEFRDYYFAERVFVKEPIYDENYVMKKISDEQVLTHDIIYHMVIADCSIVGSNANFYNKIKANEIEKITNNTKNRMRSWLYDNDGRNNAELNCVKKYLTNDLIDTLNETIEKYKEEYKKRHENGENVAEEYNKLLVDAVNNKIEECSKDLVKRISFTNKKGEFKPPKEKKENNHG